MIYSTIVNIMYDNFNTLYILNKIPLLLQVNNILGVARCNQYIGYIYVYIFNCLFFCDKFTNQF